MNANPPTSPPTPTEAQPQGPPGSPPRFPFSLLFLVWITVVLVSFVVTLFLPQSFVSSARIKVEQDHTDIRGLSDAPAAPAPYDPYFLQTQVEVLQSETILTKVIDFFDLNAAWGRKYNDGQKLKTIETLTLLRYRMSLRLVRNTSFLEILVYGENPKDAADLANQIAASYQQWRLDQSREMLQSGLRSLVANLREQEAEIRKTKAELADLAGTAGKSQTLDGNQLIYREKQSLLEEMNDLRRNLKRRIAMVTIDLDLPRNAQVMIIEHATPGLRPIRPDMSLNTWLSILLGGLLGLLLAGLVYLSQRRAYRRRAGVVSTINLSGLRTILRVTIALLLGAVVGYNCAIPMSPLGIFLMQLVVFFGGLAIAYVELAKPSPMPLPAAPWPSSGG